MRALFKESRWLPLVQSPCFERCFKRSSCFDFIFIKKSGRNLKIHYRETIFPVFPVKFGYIEIDGIIQIEVK